MKVRAVAPSEEADAIATITLAFAADPVARWTWTQSQHYLATMPGMVRAFGGNAFRHGSAHCTEAGAGVALWLPPGVAPDEETLVAIIQSTVPTKLQDDVFGVFEEMGKHHPPEPHWYLPLIGVDPSRQGRGHGDQLMTYALECCDREGVPAYLESTNPRNVSLYLRHGFKSLGRIQVGSSPPLVPMLRKPQ